MSLLHELHVDVKAPTTILCDNRNAIFMSTNSVSHPRSKHIALDYHFIRERVQAGSITVQFIPSYMQTANIFTNSLSRPQFIFFRSKLTVSPPFVSLRGGVKDTTG